MLSSDKLKAYASFDHLADSENWDNNFEGDLTVKSPLQLTQTDPLQTIRPYFAKQADTEEIRHSAPTRSPNRNTADSSKQPALSPQKPQPFLKKLALPSRPAAAFTEDPVEDYSDLFPANDAVFERKLGALKVSQDILMCADRS